MNTHRREENGILCQGKMEKKQRKKNKRKGNDMKAVLIIPIENLRGKLREDGYYFRVYRGEQIVQKCPRKWEDTPARKAARERFVEKYGRKKADS